jgi:hypothetical protein
VWCGPQASRTADSGAGTLRGDLAAANSGDTINFDPSLLYSTVDLTSGELLVNKSLTINGPADQNGVVVPNGVTLQNAWNQPAPPPTPPPNARVMEVASYDVQTLSYLHLTMAGLVFTGGQIYGVQVLGGGIYESPGANLALTDVLVTGNTLTSLNSDIPCLAAGGGIYNDNGTLTVAGSTISDNTVNGIYAGYAGWNGVSGGGNILIDSSSTVTIADSTVSNGRGDFWAPNQDYPFSAAGVALGGGIANVGTQATATITRTVFDTNTAVTPTSGIYGYTDIGVAYGGGLYNVGTSTVTDSVFTTNYASSYPGEPIQTFGGGIANRGLPNLPATLTVRRTTLSGNGTDGPYASGGGLSNTGANATAAVTNSTISGNIAHLGATTAPHAGKGGGIFNLDGTVTLSFSTVTDNRADSRIGPMAGYNYDGQAYGGGVYTNDAHVTFDSDIVAQNVSWDWLSPNNIMDPGQAGVGRDVYSANPPPYQNWITSIGHNLIGVGQGDGSAGWVASDQLGTVAAPIDPVLGPLQNNGGPLAGAVNYQQVPATHEVLPFSPALQAGNPATAPATDERGVLRNTAAPNIGAYEATLDHFLVEQVGYGPIPTNTPFSITVTAVDPFGKTVYVYTGTVTFGSSDPGATLPPAYTFSLSDEGAHQFDNVMFANPGEQTITATDVATGKSGTGTFGVYG